IKAIHFLRRAREQADVIIPFLQRATGDQDYYVADAAIDALVELRPESQFAVPLLAEQIARRVPYLMGSCALKLKRYRGEVSGVIAPMIEALRDSAVRLQDRLFMVDALGDLGVEARPAIPILFEIIESNDDWPDQIAYEWRDKVRGAAASALARLIPKDDHEGEARVQRALRAENLAVRESAGSILQIRKSLRERQGLHP
ncbi:hypothetical protein HY256_10480, partial [Candidatus Sumerlaeota bacterium]|nr:hypothetical protein [Candidatus Sumerlaeota bacterium]